ncbi:protein NLP3-like [Bidens hawaiensis]|uniref:protein NLP3-like n=1 Tax=Bidens hawaiensis TaxID=980011 RepID=UPI0040492101
MSTELPKFLENLFPIPLHHRKPKSSDNPWVFWSQNNLSSADRGTPINTIHEKIISAFYKTLNCHTFIGQFWAPVTTGGRRVLSTSGQPFAVSYPSKDFAMYRLYSSSYKYDIDHVNKLGTPQDHMIMSGGHSTAFLNCLPYMNQVQWIPIDESAILNFSIMLPICFPSQSQSYCIGVLEFTLGRWPYYLEYFLLNMIDTLKKVGLDLFRGEKLIPYKTLSYLTPTKDKIEEALKIVCGSHNVAVAQVWVTNENKNYMPFSSSLEDTRTKGSVLKLTGCLGPVTKLDIVDFQKYYSLCDVIPHGFGEEVAVKTLQDYESRYISKLYSNMVVDWDRQCSDVSALAICLRSIETGHFDYAFEFIWIKLSNYVIFLEALLLSLKRCLPGFKFASGAELGDEFDVIDVQTYAMDELDETGESKRRFSKVKNHRQCRNHWLWTT